MVHRDGIALLDGERITAYFADRAILAFLMADSIAPGQLRIADQYLTVEPYALAMRRGDSELPAGCRSRAEPDIPVCRHHHLVALAVFFGPDVRPSQILDR